MSNHVKRDAYGNVVAMRLPVPTQDQFRASGITRERLAHYMMLLLNANISDAEAYAICADLLLELTPTEKPR